MAPQAAGTDDVVPANWASMSGRAASISGAGATNTLPLPGPAPSYGVACSPGLTSRQISTRAIPESASAQPLTATAPSAPVVPVSGASKDPIGAASVCVTVNVTGMSAGQPAPLVVMVIVADNRVLPPITLPGFTTCTAKDP